MSVLFSVPSAPVVRIESAGESTAAVNQILICTVIQWTAPNGSIIGNETLVDVTVSRSSNSLSLTFDAVMEASTPAWPVSMYLRPMSSSVDKPHSTSQFSTLIW